MSENEIRVFGPPGTGKTTWMAGAVRATSRDRRTSQLLVASFTRAAATEIAGRGLPLEREQVGTLHAIAYRSIGRPEVTERHLGDWNRNFPSLGLSDGYRTDLEEGPMPEMRGGGEGDQMLAQVETLRARMIPLEQWPTQPRYFYSKWSEWKAANGLVDFTDMIELAMETECAPGNPLVGFFDEVQDFTPLELALVRHWGAVMDRVILAGDDDQCIYSFKGATPDAFLDPVIPEEQKRLLKQSHRVPRAVHRAAQAWVEHLSRREPKEYEPRDEEGICRQAQHFWRDPSLLIKEAEREIDSGRSVMILATCSYMLDGVKRELRRQGVPFHNPYRKSRGDWNPLRASRGTSASQKVAAYLVADERQFGEMSRLWTGDDIRKWASLVRKKGVFRRGAGAALENLPPGEVSYDDVVALFEQSVDLERALEPSLRWLRENLLAGVRPVAEYAVDVAAKRGGPALLEEPKVVIGTIHSVKGGEADVVFLFPDLSLAGAREWDAPGSRQDSVIRQMYVGMTRAREELVLCQASSPMAVDPTLMAMGAR